MNGRPGTPGFKRGAWWPCCYIRFEGTNSRREGYPGSYLSPVYPTSANAPSVLSKSAFTSNAGKVWAVDRPRIAPENTGGGVTPKFIVIV
jgi:hypothetical protein